MANKGFYEQGPDAIEWETPPALFDDLWDEFGGFDYDPCCRADQYTVKRIMNNGGTICVPPDDPPTWQTKRILVDGLAQVWQGKVFMNPPYARGEIIKWVSWAYAQATFGRAKTVVALLPVRSDTHWWQEFVCQSVGLGVNGLASEVRFLPKRLTFVGANNQARFASCIVIWGKVPV